MLVLGHSLHDPVLVRTLSAADHIKIAVTYIDTEGRDAILSRMGDRATAVELEFGPTSTCTALAVTRLSWTSGLRRPRS